MGGTTTAELRRKFPTHESAAKAIDLLKKASSRGANRINSLPVKQRAKATMKLNAEELEFIKSGKKEAL